MNHSKEEEEEEEDEKEKERSKDTNHRTTTVLARCGDVCPDTFKCLVFLSRCSTFNTRPYVGAVSVRFCVTTTIRYFGYKFPFFFLNIPLSNFLRYMLSNAAFNFLLRENVIN
ncbi:hypothetical protein M8J77_008725 [Diaphorina citri]|nr:hypothetical protein M8J77_008725 [Diaphorina citri]